MNMESGQHGYGRVNGITRMLMASPHQKGCCQELQDWLLRWRGQETKEDRLDGLERQVL